MPAKTSQLWLVVLVFVIVGLAIIAAYFKLRASDIQIAAGKKTYDAGKFALAEEAYQRAADLSPHDAEAWYGLGMSRKCQGKSKLAADALSKATELNPRNAQWWYECAESLQWAERFADAERAWVKTLELLLPTDGRVLQAKTQLARCLTAEGKGDQAVTMLKDVLAKQDNRSIRFVLAELLGYMGRFEESANEYQRALGGTPETKPEN